MNPIFWLLVIIILISIWFCIAFAFKSVGRFLGKVFVDTINIMQEKEKEDE